MRRIDMAPYLADLESRIDPAVEQTLLAEWQDFTYGRFSGAIFSPHRPKPNPPRIRWPTVSINAALADPDRMILQQMRLCSDLLAHGGGQLLNVRCNYGTSILPSILGAEIFLMDEALNTLPTACAFRKGLDDAQAALNRGAPDLHNGQGGIVLNGGRRFVEVMADHPRIREYVSLYHPDLQGPIDTCEMMLGSALFLACVDAPDLVQSFLALITETYCRFLHAWTQIAPFRNDHAVHWSLLHRGHIMLRDDSAMNFSPDMFDEFIRPYDQRLLDTFGGGALHFCGRGDHYIASACDMRAIRAIVLSQPEYNDMETVYRATVDRGIPLLALDRNTAETALRRGRDLHHAVHCW